MTHRSSAGACFPQAGHDDDTRPVSVPRTRGGLSFVGRRSCASFLFAAWNRLLRLTFCRSLFLSQVRLVEWPVSAHAGAGFLRFGTILAKTD